MKIPAEKPLKRECPYCHHTLTLQDAIKTLRDTCNFQQWVFVKPPDGKPELMEVGTIFPCAVGMIVGNPD